MNLRGLLNRRPAPPEPTALPQEHAVHFYDRDEALIERLVEYVLEGARLGQTAVVIATPEHRQALRDRLATWDMEESFVDLDAGQTLSLFMVDGLPDPALFAASVGALVRSRGQLRAYGEMVALLWAEGNVDGTHALEALWNALLAEVPFPLLCAYPLQDVTADLGDGLGQVCRLHTHVRRLAA